MSVPFDLRLRIATEGERQGPYSIASDVVSVVELNGEMIALGDDYGTAHIPDGDGGFTFGQQARSGDADEAATLADAVEEFLQAGSAVYLAKEAING